VRAADEFDAFLECGILAHGFLLLHCADCGHDKLVAFSCKRRGFCPSCGARRMAQTAAHLVDHVIPHVPVRQWVLSLPQSSRPSVRARAWRRAKGPRCAGKRQTETVRFLYNSYPYRAERNCQVIVFMEDFFALGGSKIALCV
jgi:hypothetical protein